VIAHLLVTEGFTTVEEIAYVATDELGEIEGFDADVAAELKNRALAFITERDARFEEQRNKLGVEDAVADLPHMTPGFLVALGEKGMKTLDDVADLASDELIEIIGADKLDQTNANELIMAARAHWFADADAAKPSDGAAEPASDNA
jgi:N utilization substance protein A